MENYGNVMLVEVGVLKDSRSGTADFCLWPASWRSWDTVRGQARKRSLNTPVSMSVRG